MGCCVGRLRWCGGGEGEVDCNHVTELGSKCGRGWQALRIK